MRGSRWIAGFYSVAFAGAACGAARTPCVAAAQPGPDKSPARGSSAVAEPVHLSSARRSIRPDADAGTVPSALKTPPPAASPATSAKKDSQPPTRESAACPEGMQLVDGDYCTEVKHKCLESWYDKSNKKTVCEKFEAQSQCVGQRKHKRFCMDRYEWPNRSGERPEVMNRFHQAE